MRGFDASRYQSEARVKLRLADPNMQFGIIAATTGASTISSLFPTHAKNLRASGKCAGFYHWLLFEQNDAKVEAAHFANTVGWQAGEIAVADVEQLSKRPKADGTFEYYIPDNAVPFTLEFSREFNRLKGFPPVLYLNLWWLDTFYRRATEAQWLELTAHRLWLAHYTGKPGVFGNSTWGTHGWDVSIHQFTESETTSYDSVGMDGNWAKHGPTYWRSMGKPA